MICQPTQMPIKKPQYIRKYDYVRYFLRHSDEWFWPTKLLEQYVTNKTLALNKNAINIDHEEEEDENWNREFDVYEYKQTSEDLDINDPKIHEGNIIDKESKKYIKAQFSACRKIYDFDELNLSNDDAFEKTMNLLVNDDNFILFQPKFIYKSKAIAKPDAFIKQNNKYTLIETKGTSSVKASHLIDLTYQHIVINECLKKINATISQYYLCLIDYRIGEKHELGFCLSEYASIVKGGYGSSNSNLIKFSPEWINERKIKKIAKDKNMTYLNLITNYQTSLPSYYAKQDGSPKKDWLTFISDTRYANIANENKFEQIIDELIKHQIINEPTLEPTPKFKTWFKDNESWPIIREYYIADIGNQHSQLFSFSGYLIKQKDIFENYYYQNKTTNEMFNDWLSGHGEKYAVTFGQRVKNKQIWNQNTIDTLKKLSSKKVYFDFESINLATRVLDDTLPFMQTVNQVSVIIDHGNGVDKNTPCNNIIFDPLTMTKEKYKLIVDALLPDKDLSICETYSYVVYNQGFEKTRLEEMKWLIDDPSYSKKIDVIIKHIFDLANFFDPRKLEYVCFAELKGFYSIKRVLSIIKTMTNDIYGGVGCLDYKQDLQVHNGQQAQMISSQRFFGLIDDQDWNTIVIDLKKYCENDVRAMVAVEYFIKKITRNS